MVSFQPEVLFTFYGIKISNMLIATFFTDVVLVSFLYFINKVLSFKPGKFQNIVESVIEYLYDLTYQVAGERSKMIFPWFATFFIFILFSNLAGLLPGFGTIGFFGNHKGEFIPLFKATTSDFNTTLGLATISLLATHALSIKTTGLKEYLKRFFSFNPVYLFIGILEIVSEIIKLFSLAFRLFGNIFAGEIVVKTISSMFAFLAPIPFLLLETIVAVVQALVFAMLTMVFMSILTSPHAEGGEH